MRKTKEELLRRGAVGALYEDGCLQGRSVIQKLLLETAYGQIPKSPIHLSVERVRTIEKFCAGNAVLSHLSFHAECEGGNVEFPVFYARPKTEGPVPAFVFLNFRPNVFDDYLPIEEIMDRGYAVFGIHYKDVSADDGNFNSGIARVLVPSRRKKDAPGKIALWAWSAMRVMDYIEQLPEIDGKNVAVIGHSRLGKTALLTAAFDERFRYAISNNSGCLGASLTRGKGGEQYEDIYARFPYWFAPSFKKYLGKSDRLPYDQHMLIGLIAPRFCLIGSAEEDLWADPDGEFLGAVLATTTWRDKGLSGLVGGDTMPEGEVVLHDGEIGYHRRRGIHYLSRRDWTLYMDFIDKKMQK